MAEFSPFGRADPATEITAADAALLAGKLCELERGNGTRCGDRADWLVGVGTRKSDAQRSCNVHLAGTCEAMYEAEGRDGAVLHVTPLFKAGDLS
jgi:hypothetical protein